MFKITDLKMIIKWRFYSQFHEDINAQCLWGLGGKYPIRESVSCNNLEYNWEWC